MGLGCKTPIITGNTNVTVGKLIRREFRVAKYALSNFIFTVSTGEFFFAECLLIMPY
jgi:hypothetical protein